MGGVIGPALAGFLMEQLGVWPAVLLTLSLAFSLVGIVLALPETLPQSIRIRPGAAHRRRHFTEHLREHAHDLKGSISLLQNRTLRLTIPALLIQSALSLANASIIITQQHISTYFEWTITQTESWLIVPNLLSLILVPLIPRIPPTITSTSPFTRDLRLAIFFTSIILEGVCLQAISAGVASAPFLIGFTLATVGGAVQAPVVRAMATMHVPRRLTARFFSWVNIAEMATSGVLWFVVRWLFDTGVWWPGLPWLFVAVIVVGAGRGLIEVRPPVEGEGKCE
jgi:MFS family permease